MRFPALAPSEKLAATGAVLTVIGSFLPWLSTAGATFSGFYLDGFMTFLFAIPIPAILYLWEWNVKPQAVTALLGVLIAVVAGNYALAVGTPGTGVGTYLVFLAGVLVAGAGLLGALRGRRGDTETAGQRARLE